MLSVILAAAEPNKVPFYFAGGALALWAVVLAVMGLCIGGDERLPLNERAIMQAVAKYIGLPFVDLDPLKIDAKNAQAHLVLEIGRKRDLGHAVCLLVSAAAGPGPHPGRRDPERGVPAVPRVRGGVRARLRGLHGAEERAESRGLR